MKNAIQNAIVGVFVFLMVLGCGSANKKTASVVDSAALDELVLSKHFKIDVDWARPMMTNDMNNVLTSLRPPGSATNQINLMGDGSFLKIEGDQVAAELSYFGERHMGGGYNSNTGIKFEGVPEDFEVVKDEKRQQTMINFRISENLESYGVNITITPKLNGRIIITSSHRKPITYSGKASALYAID